ncbi:TetR/AcrR family transcriptional regulator [Stutzerimonas kirkiae]|uniref:TetR family transcriptional regulator n=1 Tax=Stutzerimonas kirkiae TaxID=2211392 RepID=A0A4Q9RBM4_9GAMM|nr:TetR/AcrR family transcriptional regulator [Stutzerimonas kirkiae]TBU98102.1 TetR family transcriptional regulator [Stutzerimonas kirkiae]TBV02383.1 TetR family transcriptional regulator [Stutzerimonas kirkiae]TBV09261.1 TetR family transcriptional regulator [Stutzerimonas kirkiae]TBV11153.1 TetR family transcriptional regulator [Stutzerimonas kirkiae]
MILPERPSGPGRPKDPAKRQAILQAAQALFLGNGYEGSSMEAIASEAGVSKLTLYSHFKDKESLFNAAVQSICNASLPSSLFQLDDSLAATAASAALVLVRQRLQEIGLALHQLVSSPESIGLHRVMASMSTANSQLPRLFIEAGPQRLLDDLQRLFGQLSHFRLLEIEQPQRAAEHFCVLIKGIAHFYQLIGYAPALDAPQAESHVADVVALFMRAYQAAEKPA